MSWYLGIDTSNYTTSVAVWNPETGQLFQAGERLPVSNGQLGLRQSDAVFAHIKQLAPLIDNVTRQSGTFQGIGVSTSPTTQPGSYMPCFLAGKMLGESLASVLNIPLVSTSHQEGHIIAALYGSGKLDLLKAPFAAFHLSGGTTESLLVYPVKQKTFTIEKLAESMDLYAGQGVDRIGQMLGLDFPAGPQLDELSRKSTRTFSPHIFFKEGNPSISGLENQGKRMLEQGESPEDISRYVFDWLGSMVEEMTHRVREKYPKIPVVYAGGVMSNSLIQERITAKFDDVFFAPPKFSTDNAAGVAILAELRSREMIK